VKETHTGQILEIDEDIDDPHLLQGEIEEVEKKEMEYIKQHENQHVKTVLRSSKFIITYIMCWLTVTTGYFIVNIYKIEGNALG